MDDLDWIRDGLKQPGKTKKGLADALNVDPGVVTRLLKGNRILKAHEVPKVQRYLGQQEFTKQLVTEGESSYSEVPVYDVRISAGAGAIADEGSPKHHLMFRKEWLLSLTRSPSQLCVLEVKGDSMWETLHDGDHTLVDQSQINPAREGLYVLLIEDALVVKRLSMHPVNKTLTIKSDNPTYPTYDNIKPKDVKIFGRVVWIGRRL